MKLDWFEDIVMKQSGGGGGGSSNDTPVFTIPSLYRYFIIKVPFVRKDHKYTTLSRTATH